jgi:hypothetical protein
MKVNIGGYPDRLRCRIHDNYMNRKYGYVNWPDDYSKFEQFLEKTEDTVQVAYNWINWLIFDRLTQKIKVKIEPWDTWSMDHTLAHIISPMLKQLNETKHGAGFVDDEDVPVGLNLRSTEAPQKENDWDTDDNHFKRWDYVLNEMIWAFDQKLKDDWEQQYYQFAHDHKAPLGMRITWRDEEGRKRHQERMSNGFRLFGKYYEALWD